MVKSRYIPDRGHLVWLDFIPQAGHEQRGRRPVVVLSPASYNKFGLSICCPVTSQVKDYPFELAIPDGSPVSGVVLCDQVKNVDWKSRNCEFAGRMPPSFLGAVVERILTLIDPSRS